MANTPYPSAVIERLSDRYAISQQIGQPFGYQQLLAIDTHQQRPVVIKSLTLGENTPPGDICCFQREIKLLNALRHPTIPQYMDSFTVETPLGKGLILVQAHSGGQTLAQQVAAGRRYSEVEIKEIARQLLQGLIYLHSQGLVHRDVKPSSVVITGGQAELGQVSWLNLETVQYVQSQRNYTLVGTYGYMAPEQVSGQACFASDLYGLGATLIFLATGQHLGELPRHGNQIRFACATARLSPSFQQWLNWMIDPYAGNRPSSAKQALGALNHLPLAMLKRHLWKPARMQQAPVPIKASSQEHYQPFFTRIKSVKKPRSLELVVPAVDLRSPHLQVHLKRALPPLMMGTAMLTLSLYLLSLLDWSGNLLGSFQGLATLAAASLGVTGCGYSLRFLKCGIKHLATRLLRQVHIQLEADVLLVAYKYWLRSPVYVVNTRRADIYSISAQPDCAALQILTHRNRTRSARACYQLAVEDGSLSARDIRWLTSLLNDWRNQPGLYPQV